VAVPANALPRHRANHDGCGFVIGKRLVLDRKVLNSSTVGSSWGAVFRCVMSVLSTLFGCWLVFNAVLFAVLYFRRPNPKLRAKLFNWVVRGPRRRLRRVHHYRFRA
jgi:hypothetical protein